MSSKLTLSPLLLLLCLVASSQNIDFFKPDSIKKEIRAVQITGFIKVDGQLNDAEWALAPASPRFTQIEPYQSKPPSQETQVKALYNKQYLYFGD